MNSFDERIKAKFRNVEFTRDDLHLYQHDTRDFMYENPFSAVFIDMGMGKTVSTLTLIVDLLEEFAIDRVLVCGPLRVATKTWPAEISRWEHSAPYNHSLIYCFDDDPRLAAAERAAIAEARRKGVSSAEARKIGQKASTAERWRIMTEAVYSPAPIHIMSYDMLPWLSDLLRHKWHYRMVVVDESDGLKDHSSKRFKALQKVRNTKGLIERLHLLTATPAAETLEHLFAQIWLLDQGERLGKTVTAYRERYFTYNKYRYKWTPRPHAEKEILEKIADVCLVMKAEDYLPVEKPNIVTKPITLSKHVMELYSELQREFVVTLDDGTEITADSAAHLSSKLLQLASGVLYETDRLEDEESGDFKKVRKVHHIHDEKIEELKEIVERLNGEPVIVIYHFNSSRDRLKQAFPKAVVMDREGKCVDEWNKRKIPILLMHPKSGGHGLNLQHGGHNMVFFDLTWSLTLYLQVVGRLARQGQKHPVWVYLLVAKGTVDELVCKAIQQKRDGQEAMFRMLRRLYRKYRQLKLPQQVV